MLNLSEIKDYIELTQGLLDKQAALIETLSGEVDKMHKTAARKAPESLSKTRRVNSWGSPDGEGVKAGSDKLSDSERFIRNHFKVK